MEPEGGLPCTPDGYVDFAAIFADPEIEELVWRDAVPFWSVEEKPVPEGGVSGTEEH